MKVQPYLFFGGRCEEAIAFYTSAVGAEVTMLLRFKDNPEPPGPDVVPAGLDDKIMHASFVIGDTEVMASDGCGATIEEFKGVSLSIAVRSEAEAARVFRALSEGGSVQMPLGRTFFSPAFGMLADRFGVNWMVVTVPEESAAAA